VHKSGLAGWQTTMMVAGGDVLDPNGDITGTPEHGARSVTEESRRIDVNDFI
jgi:hypothetical protein